MRSVAGAACCSPHAEAAIGGRICDHRKRQLHHDCHVVYSAQVIDCISNRAECERPLGYGRQRTSLRSPVWKTSEERLEVDEERIIARASEQLDVARLDHCVGVSLDLLSTCECVQCA